MLKTRAVAPLPRASSYATAAYSAKPAPAPPSAVGTISPNRPAARRSAKSSTGNVARPVVVRRPGPRTAAPSRRAASSASLMPPRLLRLRPRALVEHGGRTVGTIRPTARRHRPAGQPAQRAPAAVGRSPRTRSRTPCRAHCRGQARAGRRTAPGRGCPSGHARHPLGHRDGDEPAQRGVVERVEHQQPARAQHPAQLGDRAGQVGHVLEDLAGAPPRRRSRRPAAARSRRRGPASRRASRACSSAEADAGRRRRAGSPGRRTCGASRPPPQPSVDQDARPAAAAGGTSRARASASQCSIAKAPSGRHHSPARSSYWRGSFRGRTTHRAWYSVSLTRRPANRPHLRVMRHGASALVRACHPEPAVAVTIVAALLAVGRRARRGRASPAVAAAVLASQLAVGWVNDWLDAEPRPRRSGATDKPVATGAVDRAYRSAVAVLVAVAGRARAGALPLGSPAALLHDRRPGLRAALQLAAEVDPVLGRCPTRCRSGCCPRSWCWRCPARRRRRPGWSRPVRCSARGAHFANVLPDLDDDARDRRTRPAAPARRRAGSPVAAAVLLLAATVAAGRSGRPGRRRGRASRPSRPPSWSCPSAGTPDSAAPPARGRLAMFRAVIVVAADRRALLLVGRAVAWCDPSSDARVGGSVLARRPTRLERGLLARSSRGGLRRDARCDTGARAAASPRLLVAPVDRPAACCCRAAAPARSPRPHDGAAGRTALERRPADGSGLPLRNLAVEYNGPTATPPVDDAPLEVSLYQPRPTQPVTVRVSSRPPSRRGWRRRRGAVALAGGAPTIGGHRTRPPVPPARRRRRPHRVRQPVGGARRPVGSPSGARGPAAPPRRPRPASHAGRAIDLGSPATAAGLAPATTRTLQLTGLTEHARAGQRGEPGLRRSATAAAARRAEAPVAVPLSPRRRAARRGRHRRRPRVGRFRRTAGLA